MPAAIGVLLAGGSGERMKAGPPKPLRLIQGRTILDHSLSRIIKSGCASSVVIVASNDVLPAAESLANETAAASGMDIRCVTGGESRFDSGRKAIDAIRDGIAAGAFAGADVVFFHDAARPCVSTETIRRVIQAARRTGAALAAIPLDDTIKRALATEPDGSAYVETTVSRERLYRAQTPQAFRFEIALDLFARAMTDGYSPTDDVQLAERYGIPVEITLGNAANIKITRPDDLALADFLLRTMTE